MKKTFLGIALLSALLASITVPAFAQDAAAAASEGGATEEEIAAYNKIQNWQVTTAADAAARVKAADEFIIAFPDSAFRAFVFSYAAEASQMMQDSAKAVFYYEKALESDPQDYNAMLMIASELANNTQEFDLNKDEKLARAETLANQGMALAESALKPVQVSAADWDMVKKDDLARAHEAMGMIAVARQNWTAAATEYQASLDIAANPQPATMIRLGNSLNQAGRPDEAMKVLDRVINMQGLPPVFIDIAKNEKTRSEQIKSTQGN